jgi:hypothetical protein
LSSLRPRATANAGARGRAGFKLDVDAVVTLPTTRHRGVSDGRPEVTPHDASRCHWPETENQTRKYAAIPAASLAADLDGRTPSHVFRGSAERGIRDVRNFGPTGLRRKEDMQSKKRMY